MAMLEAPETTARAVLGMVESIGGRPTHVEEAPADDAMLLSARHGA